MQGCLTLIGVAGVGFPVSGKQMGDIRPAVLIFRYSPDCILQPFSRLNAAGFAGCDERVDHRGAHGGCVVPAEEIMAE